MQDTQMSVQSNRHSSSSKISTTKEASQERADIKLIFKNDAPSAALPQKEVAGSERRLLIRLEDYWQSLLQSSCGPFFEDFQPSRNPVPWENCFIAYISGQGAELAFDHV